MRPTTPDLASRYDALPPPLRRLYDALCRDERASLRELQAATKASSLSVVRYRLGMLEERGLIRRGAFGKARMNEVAR
jgi:DNA-binding HxlR family transcriptional regulator